MYELNNVTMILNISKILKLSGYDRTKTKKGHKMYHAFMNIIKGMKINTSQLTIPVLDKVIQVTEDQYRKDIAFLISLKEKVSNELDRRNKKKTATDTADQSQNIQQDIETPVQSHVS